MPFKMRKKLYESKDKRHITHYRSYHLSKYLAIIGSVIICLGLISWFLIDNYTIKLAMMLSISLFGMILFIFGSIFFFKSAYLTLIEQRKDSYTQSSLAPANNCSSSSFSSSTMIIEESHPNLSLSPDKF
ncbi:hypothetical protein NH340_JMT00592 [Sarcoptes scabiei]|nr:hypothetical protein NH340_JMT00592 [Sarcoptes scabiei]